MTFSIPDEAKELRDSISDILRNNTGWKLDTPSALFCIEAALTRAKAAGAEEMREKAVETVYEFLKSDGKFRSVFIMQGPAAIAKEIKSISTGGDHG